MQEKEREYTYSETMSQVLAGRRIINIDWLFLLGFNLPLNSRFVFGMKCPFNLTIRKTTTYFKGISIYSIQFLWQIPYLYCKVFKFENRN